MDCEPVVRFGLRMALGVGPCDRSKPRNEAPPFMFWGFELQFELRVEGYFLFEFFFETPFVPAGVGPKVDYQRRSQNGPPNKPVIFSEI